MRFEAEIQELEVRGLKFGAIKIPLAGSSIQFVLTNSDINEIMSVGYLDFAGEVTWKYGKPREEFIAAIEEELRKIFKCGEHWEG